MNSRSSISANETIKYKDVAGSGKSDIGFAAVPLDKARDYAARAVRISPCGFIAC